MILKSDNRQKPHVNPISQFTFSDDFNFFFFLIEALANGVLGRKWEQAAQPPGHETTLLGLLSFTSVILQGLLQSLFGAKLVTAILTPGRLEN